MNETIYDVAVIGGSAAGAQAAISASQQMRHVLVIDAGPISHREGRAFWSKTVEFEDVPVFDAITGPDFKKELVKWVEGRPVSEVEIAGERRLAGIERRGGVVLQIKRDGDVLLLETSVSRMTRDRPPEVETFQASRIIVASGFEDIWPDIELDESAQRMYERYRAVFRYAGSRRGWHVCVRCDGHLHVNEEIAVVGVGDAVYETAYGAQDFTGRITIFTNGRPHGMTEPVIAQVRERKIKIDERTIRKHIGDGTDLLGFEMDDGEELFFHGFWVDEGLIPNTQFLTGWQVKTDADGLLAVDDQNRVLDPSGSPVPGIYAAGDVVSGGRKLITSALGMGQNAGLCATDSLRRWQYPE